MADPRIPTGSDAPADKQIGFSAEAERVYKNELNIVVVSVLIVMVMAMAVAFMLPFPQLLDITIWGFPFPYWYQFFIAWLGPILLGYIVLKMIDKNDAEREKLTKDVGEV